MQTAKKSLTSAGLMLAAVLAATGAGSVQAGVVFTAGATPDPLTVENVRFSVPAAGVDNGPDTTITGKAGRTDYLVDFSANELLIAFDQPGVTPPGVRATDGALRAIDVSVRGGAFTTFFYNLRLETIARNPAGRFADILVTSFDGSTSSFRQELRNGNNVLTLTADNATLLRGVSITSGWDIVDLRQIRVGGLQDAPVPEPGTLWSLSLAGFALWGVHTRRRNGARTSGGASAVSQA